MKVKKMMASCSRNRIEKQVLSSSIVQLVWYELKQSPVGNYPLLLTTSLEDDYLLYKPGSL